MYKAHERGINFFDTAELYPVPPSGELAGLTEEIVGEWNSKFCFVASTIIGATSVAQLDPIFEAMDFTLSDDVLKACDKVHSQIFYPMG